MLFYLAAETSRVRAERDAIQRSYDNLEGQMEEAGRGRLDAEAKERAMLVQLHASREVRIRYSRTEVSGLSESQMEESVMG